MPNHVTNRITLAGEPDRVRVVLDLLQNDTLGIGSIDFNKLIPMSAELNMEAGSRTTKGLTFYRRFIEEQHNHGTTKAQFLKDNIDQGLTDIAFDLGEKAYHNIEKYGASTWYDWCIDNWGTKWNAYDQNDVEKNPENTLIFHTAWSAPHPVIQKLVELYPDITVTHEWADEDIGNNCGRYIYEDGVRVEEYLPENAVEATEFAANVMDAKPSDWGLYLNASETDYISGYSHDFKPVKILGLDALYTEDRITEEDIPKGTYCYHLRESADGARFEAIEPHNYTDDAHCIVLDVKLDFGQLGYIPLPDEMKYLSEDTTTIDAFNFKR